MMNDITQILYWISSGLLLPVIALLFLGFIQSLLLLGGFLGMLVSRLKYLSKQKILLQQFSSASTDQSAGALLAVPGNFLFTQHLRRMLEGKDRVVVIEKVLTDFELSSEKALSASKTLARLGPMLGLMGTLIPMGPALVGLAAGDISSMAQHMQVAFSTTVIGLFVGIIGYVTQLNKQRWYLEDLSTLDFIYKSLHHSPRDHA